MVSVSAFTLIEIATTAVAGVTATIGLYIGYQAYRGLRRHGTESLRYLSIGLFLLFGVTYVAAFLGNFVLRLGFYSLEHQEVFRLVVRLVQLSGVLSIAYALYLTRDEERTASSSLGDD